VIHEHSRHPKELVQLDALIAPGDATACTDPEKLITAAQDGRVAQLFIARHSATSGPGEHDTETATVDPAARDGQERAAQLTLRHGGEIWVVAPDRLPNGTPIAAALRY